MAGVPNPNPDPNPNYIIGTDGVPSGPGMHKPLSFSAYGGQDYDGTLHGRTVLRWNPSCRTTMEPFMQDYDGTLHAQLTAARDTASTSLCRP